MNAPVPHLPTADELLSLLPDEPESEGAHTRPLQRRTYRRRRRGQREDDKVLHNHQTDRWMVSYADFITLLFAFFVVMYAMSSVNEGRYRVLSGALSTAFSPADGSHATVGTRVQPPVPIVPPVATPAPVTVDAPPPATARPPSPPTPPVDPVEQAELARTAERVQHMQQLATRVDEQLQSLVANGQVQVARGARGIAIEIDAAVLFNPASADLKPASFDALRSLSKVLSGFVEPVQIEGHSDDVPIATREFRSNWELSAARAASVGRFLIAQGVSPARIGIAGYAEYRPIVGNTDASSRARNRRVTLVVLSADDAGAVRNAVGQRSPEATPSRVVPPEP